MQRESDEDRIRRKAHQLWEAEGRPHGRDQDHWDQAREIIAIEDSQASTLLPRNSGTEEPIENAEESLRNLADFPNLTDQGENLLTSTDREPTFESGSSDMPSVEVPITDQPGIPEKRAKSSSRAAGQGDSPKSSSRPGLPVSAPDSMSPQPKTASVPKVSAPSLTKDGSTPRKPSGATTRKK